MLNSSLQTARYRLAEHYLKSIGNASAAVQQGGISTNYSVQQFEDDWEQIKQWQAWSAKYMVDQEWNRLCKAFALDGYGILNLRRHPEERIEWLEAALASAQLTSDTGAACILLFRLFQDNFSISRLDKAEENIAKLRELAHATKDNLHVARAVYGQACIQEERGRYKEAQRGYLRCYKKFEALNETVDLSNTLNGLGSVALYLADYEQAQIYFSRHLHLAEQSGQDAEICRALFALAEVNLSIERYAEAETYAKRGVTVCRQANFKRLLASGLMTLGSCAIEQNHMDAALVYLDEGIKLARTVAFERNLIHGLSTLGYVRFRVGHYDEALQALQEAVDRARQANLPRFVCNALRHIVNVCIATGDLEEATTHLVECLTLSTQLASDLQKIRTLAVAVALCQARGLTKQGAIWAGLLVESPDVDVPVLQPVLARLQITLGSADYAEAIEQGRLLSLDEAISHVQSMLSANK